MGTRPRIALWLLCVVVYLCFAPGRILYPDDEIVFQTTQALWERGDLAIEGIPKRTGEPRGRPDGTFGWAPGVDGRRYGFFGHGLSVVALPLYGLGKSAITHAPAQWRHVIRSDHFFLHVRSPQADWPRLTVSLTNCFITAFAALVLVEWLRTLGHRDPIAMLTGLLYAFGTCAWPYSGTFLSEPLSALVLLACAWFIANYHRHHHRHRHRHHHRLGRGPTPGRSSDRQRVWLWMAGLVAGLSVHVHVLNLLAIPCLAGYALVPIHRASAWSRERSAWLGAIALGLIGPITLGVTQALRYGDPWQTGRYDHYGYFVEPLTGLVGQMVGPGRSLWLYSPALIIALLGWRRAFDRDRAASWMVVALCASRLLFVSARSDWWGGWGIGPRYLVPLVPLLLLPLAEVLDQLYRASRRRRWVTIGALVTCVGVELHLALHSIFEWMIELMPTSTPQMDYLTRSHWIPSASPLWGFWSLPPDTLAWQAHRLAEQGHPGPWRIYLVAIAIGVGAGLWLARWLRHHPARRR